MRISLIQLCSKLDFRENLKHLRVFLSQAKDGGAQMAFLPEYFYSLPAHGQQTPYLVEKDNEHYQNIQKLAQEFSLYLIGAPAASRDSGRVVNRAYNFDPSGRDLGHYDKIHLFACDLPNKKVDEGELFVPGNETMTVQAEGLTIGLTTCFDLRFPELFQCYRLQGAQVITVASAFTVPTGRAHWEILIRARAIENQCFIVAAGQWGDHHPDVQTWGHSLVVDPWGQILADAGEGEKVIFADLDMAILEQVRHKIRIPGP